MSGESKEGGSTLHEKCDRCGVVGQDRRTLFMACLYEMSELGVPFVPRAFQGVPMRFVGRNKMWGYPEYEQIYRRDPVEPRIHPFYTLLVCKGCRADWLKAITDWFRAPPTHPGSNDDENLNGREPLATILADAERARTDLIAIQSRLEAVLPEMRLALDNWDNLAPLKGRLE